MQNSSAVNSPGFRAPTSARPATTPSTRHGGAGGNSESTESNIKVYIRTRPAATISGATCVTADPEASKISLLAQGIEGKAKTRGEEAHGSADTFVFEDGVLNPDVSQEDVFDAIGRPAADAVMEGYNVTVFAYGQTGAGKTHSIYGSRGQCDEDDSANPQAGLTDRVIAYIISSGRAEEKTSSGVSCQYEVSMLDIYDEKVRDLFEPGHEKNEKKVREDPNGRIYVEGQNWKTVASPKQAEKFVREGLQSRKVCYTSMNSASSRSHTICMFKISRDKREEDGGEKRPRQERDLKKGVLEYLAVGTKVSNCSEGPK